MQVGGFEASDWLRILAELPQLIWTCGADGMCDHLSPQWVAYTGIPEREQLGSAWLDQLHPDDRERLRASLNTVAPNRTFDVEFRIRRHDGVYRWFQTRLTSPLEGGEGARWVGSATDVQELKDAKAALRKANHDLEGRVLERTEALAIATTEAQSTAVQLQLAQRVAKMGSWTLDIATNHVEWSEQLFHTMGLDPTAGAPSYPDQVKLYAPESWQRLAAAIERSIRTGEGYVLELEVIRTDGERRWCVARAESTRGPDGTVVTLTGTFQDITELKQTQLALERTSERMQLATAAARLGVWDLDLDTNVLTWDSRMHELYGVAAPFPGREEVRRSHVHPEDLAKLDRAVQQALAGEATFDVEFRIFRGPARAIRHLRGAAIVHRDAEGRPRRFVGVNWDVTEQREAELALRANERLLREFVKHAPAAIAMLDREMRYIQASDRWLRDYKLSDQQIIGRSHYEVFPDIPQRWKEIHQRALAGAVESCDEDPFPRADGGMEWLQWEVRPWLDAAGQVGGLIFFTHAITSRKVLENTLRQQKASLEESNEELKRFAYVASHDLQEPLRAVAGCTQLFARRYRGQLDAEADELLRHIVEGSERMHNLIRDLLAYSRVDRHSVATRTDANEALSLAIANLSVAIAEANAAVTHDTLPAVWVDRSQLVQLFQNLVGNAIKYRSAEPPRIHVSATTVKGGWELRVTDNGIGIEPQYHERIFQLFQRLHTRGEYPGTGIGLAICKKIIQRHGGRIWVEEAPGGGCVFCFTLPSEMDGEV